MKKLNQEDPKVMFFEYIICEKCQMFVFMYIYISIGQSKERLIFGCIAYTPMRINV